VASINYRLSQEARFPAQIDDCKAAVRWVRTHAAEYGLDKDHIGACGASSGAHLAALLGTTCGDPVFDIGGAPETVSSCVQAVCDMCGPTDLTKYPTSEYISTTNAYPAMMISAVTELVGPVESNLETAKRASPLFYAERKTQPFLIIHGDQDAFVPLSDSKRFYDALKKNGNDATLLVLHSAHLGREFMQPDLIAKIISFFDKYLRD
jgi:acetyl esterase/lipase